MTTSTTNGALAAASRPAEPPVPGQPGPRMPKRTVWVDLPETTPDGDEAYPGFKVRVWVNFPARLAEEFQTGDAAAKEAILRRIVLEHNGWLDDEENLFPPADDPAFYQALPTELAVLIVVAIQEAMSSFPNSLLRMRRASAGT